MSSKEITGYHAHIYFRDADEKARALALRERLGEHFAAAVLGRVHDRAVGPHTEPMYQVAFSVELFAELTPWLMLHSDGLSVFIHPLCGDALAEHRDHAMWLGAQLPLNLSVFS